MAKKFIIGIDLGGTNLKIALLSLNYKILDKKVLSTKRFMKKENLIKAIIDSTNKTIKYNQLKRANILGVGLGLPGPIDVKKGIVHFFPNIPGWKEVKLRNILEKKLRLPVFLDNDAKLAAGAEYKLGVAKNFKNVVCLTLGTGVGAGIILEGNLYRGTNYASGELGHIPLNEKGPRCNCGGIGCLETYIGNNRILSEAKKLFRRRISLEELSALAKKENQKARALWSRVATHLGIALSGVVNLLNPDCIVIGGGIANAGKVLFKQVKKVISQRAMPVQGRHVKILKSKLGNDAGLIGAAILVKEKVRGEDFY
jgi:glucokinase